MIKRRNMWVQGLFIIATTGIYLIWWFYITATEMLEERRLEGNPMLWALLFFVPLGAVYSCWKYSQLVEEITGGKYHKVLMYAAWLLFPPAVWALVQIELKVLAQEDA